MRVSLSLVFAGLVLVAGSALVPAQQPSPQAVAVAAMGQQPAPRRYLTGAVPTPRHKLAAAKRHMPRANLPASFLVLPSHLDVWANDTYGDCVTAEEAFSIACWSVQSGRPEVFVDSPTVVKWARQHGVLNGADLTSVMDSMASDGIQATDGKTYHGNATYAAVDWTNYQALCSAIYVGPVKLGMAARQLQHVNGVGERNGWFASGFRHDNNEDHCTSVCGYGTAQDLVALFQQKGVTVSIPNGVQPTTPCLAYFTWGTIGIMDHQSLINTTGEAWVRDPSVMELPAPGPNPPPPPTPTPSTITYTLGPGAPAGATIDAQGNFSWPIPANLTSGTITISFTATSGGSSATGSFTITVTPAGQLHIAPIPDQTAPAGSTVTVPLGQYVTTSSHHFH